jgi:hypothetical protein
VRTHAVTARRSRSSGVSLEDVRALASGLPRSYEAYVGGRVKFRVGQIVYVSFSRDEAVMGFGFPKEWRDIALESEPHKFIRPSQADLRYNWLLVKLAAIDHAEMRDLVIDAWQMCVPKSVAAEYLERTPHPRPLPEGEGVCLG